MEEIFVLNSECVHWSNVMSSSSQLSLNSATMRIPQDLIQLSRMQLHIRNSEPMKLTDDACVSSYVGNDMITADNTACVRGGRDGLSELGARWVGCAFSPAHVLCLLQVS